MYKAVIHGVNNDDEKRRHRSGIRRVAAVLTALLSSTLSLAAPPLEIDILYLWQPIERPATLSTREPPPSDEGVAGARVAIADSNTTGRFTGHHYSLTEREVANGDDALNAATQWAEKRNGLIIVDIPDDSLTTLAHELALGSQSLVINAGSQSDQWRTHDCRRGLLHTAPSYAMLADGLGQFLIARQWRDWFIIKGPLAADEAWTEAFKRTAKRYGAKVRGEKTWSFETDLRRTAQAELPLFTQARDYDVVLVADAVGDVGEFVPYNTWLPRPVAGTQGLTPTTWSPVIEQWGALQLQNRFAAIANRPMTAKDYNAWAAVRSIAESVTRTNTLSIETLLDYMLSDAFELAGFKGRGLTFRAWNGQLRQPVTLVQPRAVVSQSPQKGFLHPNSELDTLGFDEPEVNCRKEANP